MRILANGVFMSIPSLGVFTVPIKGLGAEEKNALHDGYGGKRVGQL